MTTEQKVARRKLSLLELATDLGNVSKACKVMGYSRQQFYEIRRNFQTFGSEGLLDRLPGARGPHPNRVSEEVEKSILDHALTFPTHGPCASLKSWHSRERMSVQGESVASGAAITCSRATNGFCAWSGRPASRSWSLPSSRCACWKDSAPSSGNATSKCITPVN